VRNEGLIFLWDYMVREGSLGRGIKKGIVKEEYTIRYNKATNS